MGVWDWRKFSIHWPLLLRALTPGLKPPGVQGNDFIKQPVLVARRTLSGTGPIVGAAARVAVLRLGRWRPFAIERKGFQCCHPAMFTV